MSFQDHVELVPHTWWEFFTEGRRTLATDIQPLLKRMQNTGRVSFEKPISRRFCRAIRELLGHALKVENPNVHGGNWRWVTYKPLQGTMHPEPALCCYVSDELAVAAINAENVRRYLLARQ